MEADTTILVHGSDNVELVLLGLEAYAKTETLNPGSATALREKLLDLIKVNRSVRANTLRQRAMDEMQRDGELEIDPGAVISFGDGKGAYVLAWVWIYFNDDEENK